MPFANHSISIATPGTNAMTAKATIIRELVTVTPNTRFVLPALAGSVSPPACRLVLILDAELGLANEILLKGVADTDGAAVMAGDEAAFMLRFGN